MKSHGINSTVDRRDFVRRAAGLGGLLALGACAPSGGAARWVDMIDRRPIGLQLFTVRDQLGSDFAGTLERVAEVGYSEFEFAGYYNHSPAQVRDILDRLDATAPASHVQLGQFRGDIARLLGNAQVMGHQYLIVPIANGRTAAGWRELAAEFNRIGEVVARAGLQFGYHNHAGEFEDLGGGVTAYDILLRETDPALVAMELDLYWAVRGGQDPVAMFERDPGRYRLFHVKDMTDRNGSQAMAPVGEGELDFAAIFARAAEAGVEHYFVEHDNAADSPGGSLESVTISHRNLRGMLP